MKSKRDKWPDKTERKFLRWLRKRKDKWKMLCKRWCFVAFAIAGSASAADTIVFTPSTTVGVTNYTLNYGPTNRTITNRIHIGTNTSWVVTNVSPGSVSFIFASAWTNGIESLPSNEILYTNRNFQPTIEIRLNMKTSPTLDGPRENYTNVLVAVVPATGEQQFFFMDALATLSQ